jgi:hypothetical protein
LFAGFALADVVHDDGDEGVQVDGVADVVGGVGLYAVEAVDGIEADHGPCHQEVVELLQPMRVSSGTNTTAHTIPDDWNKARALAQLAGTLAKAGQLDQYSSRRS